MSKFRKKLCDNSGFTLIELLVVIAVLGILAGIAVPRLTGVTDKAKLADGKSVIGTIKNAMEMYYAENGTYPGTSSESAIYDYVDQESISDNWAFTIESSSDTSYEIKLTGANDYDSNLTVTYNSSTGSISTTTP